MILYRAFIRWGLPKALLSDKGSQFRATHRHGEADYQYYAKRLGIEVIYAHRAQTKGKIERLFRFIQRDFVMEHLDLTSLEAINEAFGQWVEEYNFRHEHKGIDKECAAGLYVPSLRKVSLEEIEFILVQEEPRRSLRLAALLIMGSIIGCLMTTSGRRVWTSLKGETLTIEAGKKVIAKYQLKHDRLDFPIGTIQTWKKGTIQFWNNTFSRRVILS